MKKTRTISMIISLIPMLMNLQYFADFKKLRHAAFDLQLFTDLTQDVTPGNTTGADGMSPTMKTFYNTALLKNARAAMVFNQNGFHQGIGKHVGKKIEWRRMNKYANAPELAEGVIPVGKKATLVSITAEMKQYGDFTPITDVLEYAAVDPLISMVTEEHAAQLANTSDILTRNAILEGITNVVFAKGSATSRPTKRSQVTAANLLTSNDVNFAATLLKNENTPFIDGKFIAFINPLVAYDLRNDSAWIDCQKYKNPENIFKGEIGELHGVRFIETTNEKYYTAADASSASDTATVPIFETIIFGANAYGIVDPEGMGLEMIVKPKEVAGGPLEQFCTVGGKMMHAAKVLDTTRILRIESACSMPITESN